MVGAIDYGPSLGGWDIKNLPIDSLPEEVATAVGAINELGYFGATFEPIWYIGSQVVNGMNYKFLCRETRTTRTHDQAIVAVTVNVPAGDFNAASIVSVEKEADLTHEQELVFKLATVKILGVEFTPVVFVGTQIVKGKNYYYICEAKPVYPDAVPYAVTMTVNIFGSSVNATEITPIAEPGKTCGLGQPLGEWP